MNSSQYDVIDCLQNRRFIDALTSDELRERLQRPCKVYVGFDPTADSLHLGNLLGIVALRWFQRFGHTPVVVLGGATGRIGDPSGKSVERPLLETEKIASNVKAIGHIFETLLKKDGGPAPLILNNDSWFAGYPLIDFLRDIGKHFRIGNMLAKESVRSRLQSEEGMSFTEFSYQILQAYDFYRLHDQHGVVLQMGGSDQWGNITAGVELIRKLCGKPAYGLTWPLLTRSDGKKFGKTEGGAIWLTADKCSPYQFYQYLVRVPDADVGGLMRMLTFMPLEEIGSYEQQLAAQTLPPNRAQKRLAEEVTRFVHGEEGLAAACRATEGIAPGSDAPLDAELLQKISADIPHKVLKKQTVIGQKWIDVAVAAALLESKGEAVRLVRNGGAYMNNEKIEDPNLTIGAGDCIGGKYLLFGAGKKKKILITLD